MRVQTVDGYTGQPREFGLTSNGTTGITGVIVPFLKDGVDMNDPLFKYGSNGNTVFVSTIEAKGGKIVPLEES